MERKKRSKGWEICYVKKIYGTFGVEMRACGQKLVKFCARAHARACAAKLVVEIVVSAIVKLFVMHNIKAKL